MPSIPLPPAPQLGAAIAYSIAAGSVLAGLVITFFGCRLHYLLAGLVGAGVGFALAPVVQPYIGMNPIYVQIGVVLVAAAVLALAAKVTWPVVAGAVGAAVTATVLLMRQAPGIPQEASQSLAAWWQHVAPAVFDMDTIKATWRHDQAHVLLVMFPATVLPLLLGVFFNRAVMLIVTALIGATATVAGLIVGLAQVKARLWPQSWMDMGVLGIAVVVITLIGAICQCLFTQRRKDDKEKDEEKA